MQVKTPLIIKDVLGQQVYDLFEKYRKSLSPPDLTIRLWTNAEGKRLLEEAIKKEYVTRKQREKRGNKI